MHQKKNLKKYFEWVALAVLVFGFLKLIDSFGIFKHIKPETGSEKVIMIIGIVVMTFIVLGIHELGHLLIGLAQGFRFELFVVGPLGIRRKENKIEFYLNKNLGYYGGVAASSPTTDDPGNAKKFARLILAGPVFSLLFSVVFLIIAYFIGKPLGMAFYTGGIISLGIFFATTVPSRTGMFFTDRKRYQRLVTPGKDQQVEIAMLKIIGTFSKDNSYKNVDVNDIRLLAADQHEYIRFMGLFNLVCYELEHRGSVDEETNKAYKATAAEMPLALVAAFDKEIEKYRNLVKKAAPEGT